MTDRPHPITTARRALLEAAAVESDPCWRDLCQRFAHSLPPRAPIPVEPELPENVVTLAAHR